MYKNLHRNTRRVINRMLNACLLVYAMCCVLCLQECLVHGDSCDQNLASVCERLSQLQTTVAANSVYLRKWSPHYDFVTHLKNDFEVDVSRIAKDAIAGMPARNPPDESPGNSNKIADILLDIKNLQDAERRYKEEKERHSLKLEATENQIQEIYKTIRKVEKKSRKLKDEIAEKLKEMKTEQKEEFSALASREESRSRELQDEILRKIEESRKENTDIFLNILSQAQATEKRVNETQQMLFSITSTNKSLDHVIRENISAPNESLGQILLEFLRIQSNWTLKIRAFETELSKMNAQYASSYDILNRTLQDVSNFSKLAEQSLRNHSLEVSGLKLKMNDVDNRCSNPPRIKNGYIVNMNRSHGAVLNYGCQNDNGAVLSYGCQDDMTLVDNGKVECHFGEWIGTPPICMENCDTSDLNMYHGLDVFTDVIYKHSEILDIRCRKGYQNPYPGRIIKCENGVWNVPDLPCIKGHFDATFVLRAVNGFEIACYSYETYNEIEFSRVLGLDDVGVFPRNATNVTDPNAAILNFEFIYNYFEDVFDGIQCKIDNEYGSFKILTMLQRGEHAYLYPLEAIKVANIGDMIELEVKNKLRKSEDPLTWTHNGKHISSWNGKQKVVIPRVKLEDAGVYKTFFGGNRYEYERSYIVLNVRKCSANMFGKLCDQNCPKCYNGGICHDDHGVCICPAGFTGFNCEKSCERGFFGSNCSRKCPSEEFGCQYQLFCKPNPFGCACAAGYRGVSCQFECTAGWYGADCKQECHCAKGPDSCNIHTGACAGGCSEGWKGDSCQIEYKESTCAKSLGT